MSRSIARSWYLTGALELEGAIDPSAILAQMGGMFAESRSSVETVRGWRYRLDAGKASGRRLAVGLCFAGTGDALTVRVRHSIVVVEDGIAGDCDGVVELNGDGLAPGAETPVSGDPAVYGALHELLDLDDVGFHMHMR